MGRSIAVYRKEHFNAAHRLHSSELSAAANAELYGKCNNPNYHGHNYELIVKVVGEVDPVTGFVIDTGKLSRLIRLNVTEVLDHRNLNLDIPELSNINPTTENLAIYIFNKIRALIDERLELKVILYETERNFVEYPA